MSMLVSISTMKKKSVSRTRMLEDEFPNRMKEVQSMMTFGTAIINSMKLVGFREYFNVKFSDVCFYTHCRFEGKIRNLS